MVDFAASTHAVSRDTIPFEDALGRIREIGFRSVLLLTSPDGPVIRPDEPTGQHIPNVLASRPHELGRRLADAGLSAAALYAAVRPDASTPEAARAFAGALGPYVDYAVALGCPNVCVGVPRTDRPLAAHETKRDGILRYAEAIDAAAARDGSGAVAVSVDLHYHSLLETLEDCRLYVRSLEHPGSGLLLNIGHLTTTGQEGWRLIDECPERLPVIAWKDHSLAPDRPHPVHSIELGTGDSPFREYVRVLKRRGAAETHTHIINVEHAPPGHEIDALRRSLVYIQDLWARTA